MFVEDQESKMCRHLRNRWRNRKNPSGFHIQRSEILAVGADMDLDSEKAVELFRSLEYLCWSGEYHQSDRFPRTAAWVSKVY